MLSKGKGIVISKLCSITLIEADSQFITQIYIGGDKKEMIENNNRFSKANYSSRKTMQLN